MKLVNNYFVFFYLPPFLQKKVAENFGQILQISKLFQIAQTAHLKSCQSIDFNCI